MSRYNIKWFLRMKSNENEAFEMVFQREKSKALVTRYNNSNEAALVGKVSALTPEFRSKLSAILLSAI